MDESRDQSKGSIKLGLRRLFLRSKPNVPVTAKTQASHPGETSETGAVQ